jgi:trigger factor
MNVTIENVSACRKRLKIEVPANRVNEAFEKVTDDFQKLAKIPGFRPGRAPRTVVQKKFLKDIEDELQRTLVPEAYREAVQAKKLKVVSSPDIEELKYQRGLSLSFSTVVDLAPDFSLPAYKGLAVKKIDASVSDQEADKALEGLLEQRAEFIDVPDRPLAMEDFAVISYTGASEGKPLAEWVPTAKNLGQNEHFWLWMKPDMFLPGFTEPLVGLKPGEKRTVHVEFAADFPHEVLRGKKAQYEVELKQIKNKKLPELTEELAQEIAKMSVAELKVEIRKDLEGQKESDAKTTQKREIVDQLLKAVNFDLPESVVAAETRDAVYNIVAENQARGVPENILQEKKQEIFTNAAAGAKDMVKLNFLLRRIADEEKITVSTDEIGGWLQYTAQRQGVPFDKFLENAKKNNTIPQVEQSILRQKVLDFLLQQAKVE